MCAAFPNSEYYASSDFSLYYASWHPRYYTCLPVLHPRGTARSPTFTHLPYGATPRPTTPDVPKQPCPFSAAQILLDGYSRPPATSTTITRLNSFTLADCGSAPPLITLDPCRHLLCEMARRKKILGMSLTRDENSVFNQLR